jgi:hypothetical protein
VDGRRHFFLINFGFNNTQKMPQSEGGYVSLNETANVYNSTTEPTKTKTVLESVKKAIEHAVGKHEAHLLNSNDSKITIQAMNNLR